MVHIEVYVDIEQYTYQNDWMDLALCYYLGSVESMCNKGNFLRQFGVALDDKVEYAYILFSLLYYDMIIAGPPECMRT